MKQIEITDLKNIIEYEKIRNDARKEIIEYKVNRRIILGSKISMVFENRTTMIFQIQEMMRAERMVHDETIQHEVDVYNSLLPNKNELSATLFIEITDETRIKEDLQQFIGLTNGDKLWIQLNDHKIFAEFEEGRSEDDKISSVHYIRFKFEQNDLIDLTNPEVKAMIKVSHNGYDFEKEISEGTRKSFIADLTE